jgi:ABC-type branched-subunit amino acid transport system substrate-binding protein
MLSEILEVDGPIDVIIGPGCSGGCTSTATLAQAKAIAQISPFCGSPALSNKPDYPVFMRTTSPYSKWASALLGLMGWAQWRSIAFLRDSSEIMALSALSMRSKVEEQAKYIAIELWFASQESLPSTLPRIKLAGARVVMALAYATDYLAIAIAARTLKFSEGWAWIGVDMVADAGTIGEAFGRVVTPQDAQGALQGWLYMEPYSDAPTSFFDRVRRASIDIHGQQIKEDEPINSFASNLYDAIFLFAHAATRYPELLADGRKLAEMMMNYSFQGLGGGIVELDRDGDKKESIRVLNYVAHKDGSSVARRVGLYAAIKAEYTPDDVTVIWPGGSTDIPSTAPLENQGFNTAYLLGGAGAATVLTVTGLVVLVRKKGLHLHHLQEILAMLFTEASALVGISIMELSDVVMDGITCYKVVQNDIEVPSEVYKDVYVVFMCLGAVGAIVSIAYHVRNSRLVMEHVRELEVSAARGENLSEGRRQMQVYEWELEQSFREQRMLALALLSLLIEGAFPQANPELNLLQWPTLADIPMSVLNCCIVLFDDGRSDRLVRTDTTAAHTPLFRDRAMQR